MSDASKYDLLRHLRLSADISVPTLADLYALQTFRRKWGVSVYVYEDGANTGTYRLVKGHNSDNPQDNLNWVKDAAVGKSVYDYIETVANVITWDASTGLKKLGIISNNATIKLENLQNGMDGFMKLEVQANDVGIDFDSGVTMFFHGENELLQEGVYRIWWHMGETLEIGILPYYPYSKPVLLEFTSVWDTTKTSTGSSAINQVRLPLISTGVYDFVVDWGDGNQDTITSWNQAEVLHTYVTQGIYTIRITGLIDGFRFNSGGDRLKLHNVAKWGPLKLTTDACFYGCANFTSDADDWPLVQTSSYYRMFRECTLFNGDVSNWNTSGVSNMSECFRSAPAFNQDIGGWDVSAVTNMDAMFIQASAFNNGGSSNIGNWVIKNDAPVSMSNMFQQAPAFNQDIGGWDVSAVTSMYNMFLSGGLSNANYNNILVGWTGWTSGAATKTLQNSVPFHAGAAKYSSGDPADARAWLVLAIGSGGKGWAITDGGAL